MSSTASFKRTCPWCGVADVHAFSDEGAVRALTAHLESCAGTGTETPPAEPAA